MGSTPAMKEKFEALNAFRGLAAACVAVDHLSDYLGFKPVPRADIAVDLFFLLSGFVVAYSYEEKLARGLTVTEFMLVRWVRLYPLYFVSLLLAVGMTLTGVLVHHRHPLEYDLEYIAAAVAAVFVLPMHVADTSMCFPFNTSYWTLFYEFLNNFVFAAVRPLLTTQRLACLVTAAAVVLALIAHRNGEAGVGLGQFWSWLSVSGGFARSIFGFFGGVLLSRIRTRLPAAWLGRGYVLPTVIIATLFLTPLIGPWDWVIQILAVVVVFPLCIARVVCNPQPDVPRALRTIGVASYPLYLLHLPLAHGLDLLTHKQLTHFAPFGGIGLLMLIFTAAVLTAHHVDPPLRRAVGAVVFNRTLIPALKPSIYPG